ncbi:MAG: Holliday junction resolvase RuvX [Chloroflexota bacterium]|nr:Holliday junction resolvase RuvX [Chloroflexota bacterium]MDE2947023.1 Holliday junction resolvase RuvX [Chloroflexota bacterium]
MIGRLIGVDHGRKRIGLAISDALGLSAREHAILQSRGEAEDFAAILAIAKRENAAGIVVGVPQNPNAPPDIKTQADVVREWIARLRSISPLPIVEVSEYLTSEEARSLARQLKRSPRDAIDDLAARVILQAYLDALSYGSATFPPSESSV